MKHHAPLALLLLLMPAAVARAEFTCRAEVSYTWRKGQEETDRQVATVRLEATGADEGAAKAILEDLSIKPREEALARCRQNHENQAACVAARYASYAPTMNTLGFAARKKLEEAIASDCVQSQGSCSAATLGTPTCTEKVVAEETPAKDAKGKDAKKK